MIGVWVLLGYVLIGYGLISWINILRRKQVNPRPFVNFTLGALSSLIILLVVVQIFEIISTESRSQFREEVKKWALINMFSFGVCAVPIAYRNFRGLYLWFQRRKENALTTKH